MDQSEFGHGYGLKGKKVVIVAVAQVKPKV
jgi:hypothetical protein